MWRTFLNNAVRSTSGFRRLTSKLIEPPRRCFKTVVVLNCTAAAALVTPSESKLSFLSDLQKACAKNNGALRELMQAIGGCLEEISREYQQNIEKQIEIMNRCNNLGPIGEHWDELTKYRVHANELKEELMKYENLAQKIGQMAYNQAVTSLLSGVENAMDLVEVDYGKLESLVIRLAKDTHQWEMKLLYAHRDSILTALK